MSALPAGAKEKLLLEAVVSYANSCTLPSLTPTCPFYESTVDGPRCGEQCRTIAAGLGHRGAEVETHDVGGLRFTGRALPIEVVAGTDDFDATQLFLEDFRKPLFEQRTGSLLLLLRTCIVGSAMDGEGSVPAVPIEVWGELLKRGLDMERVASGELIRELAVSLAVSIVLDKLRASLQLQEYQNPNTEKWAALLSASASSGSETSVGVSRRVRHQFRRDDLQQLLASAGFPEGYELPVHEERLLAHALGSPFMDRVIQWLRRLFAEDLGQALALSAPPPGVFAALPARNVSDEVGSWLWERFTRTDLDHWAPSSLAMEWQWLNTGQAEFCDQRVLGERRLDESEVASRALRKFASPRNSAPAQFDLRPSDFVMRASELLMNGEWAHATAIFEGLAELRPGDAEAWNNLGFCLIATDTAHALTVLRRARSLSVRPKRLTVANEMLTLHLLGRDNECLALAAVAEEATEDDGVSLRMWIHPSGENDLELAEPSSLRQYIDDLLVHVRSEPCDARAAR